MNCANVVLYVEGLASPYEDAIIDEEEDRQKTEN